MAEISKLLMDFFIEANSVLLPSVPFKVDEYRGYPHTFWATPNLEIVDKFRSKLLEGLDYIRNTTSLG